MVQVSPSSAKSAGSMTLPSAMQAVVFPVASCLRLVAAV
jgi:hypothetical protein